MYQHVEVLHALVFIYSTFIGSGTLVYFVLKLFHIIQTTSIWIEIKPVAKHNILMITVWQLSVYILAKSYMAKVFMS